MVSLDGSFNGSNDGKLECLLLGGSLGLNDGNVIGSNEGIKLIFTDGKAIVVYLEMYMESHLGFMLKCSWDL